MKSRGFQRQIFLDTESCPSWPKEHDWKSCSASTSTRGFESLALRQKKTVRKYRLLFLRKGFEPRRNGCGAGTAAEPSEKGAVHLFPRWIPGGSCSPPKKTVRKYRLLFLRKGFEPEMGANDEQSETRSDRETVWGTVSTFLQRSKATARKSLALRQN